MINDKSEKEIDTIIHEQLMKNLNINKTNVNIVTEEFFSNFLDALSTRKSTISLLFSGNFSLTEQNIKEKLSCSSCINNKKTHQNIYSKIANSIISKRLKFTIDKLLEQNKEDAKFVSVCLDRQLFIDEILSKNIDSSFIESCIEDEPYR